MAKNIPAFQFYPSDFWVGVAGLSDEATGIYIKLLCQLWIQKNLLSFCFSSLAAMAQTTPDVLERVWPEIEDKFQTDGENIWHARFAEMIELSEKRRLSGQNGGRPKKQTESKRKANQKQNDNQNESKSKANSRRMKNEDRRLFNKEIDESFERFWEVFPSGRKGSRGKALPAFKSALEKTDAETLIESASEYAASPAGKSEFVQMPATWLNGECWLDDREAWQRTGNKTRRNQDGAINDGTQRVSTDGF